MVEFIQKIVSRSELQGNNHEEHSINIFMQRKKESRGIEDHVIIVQLKDQG